MQTEETAEAAGNLAGEKGVRFLTATFRNILLVVFLIFIFAGVQMLTLWEVCKTGMNTAVSLEHQGLPALNELASLEENLALYRLDSYEYLFAQEAQKAGKAKAAEAIAVQIHAELKNIQTLFPEGEGRHLAANLENAVDDLDTQFRKVRSLVDADFPAAMKSMDQDIPPRTERVDAAADALKTFGYKFSGAQANATFASFGWIKTTAVMFGAANSLVVFGAVMFILLAARRSRAHLAETLARLDERTGELAYERDLLGALMDNSLDHIYFKDSQSRFIKSSMSLAILFGAASSDKMVGKTDFDFFTEEHARPAFEDEQKIIRTGIPLIGKVEKEILKNGRVSWALTSKMPFHNKDGQIIGTFGISKDITVIKQAEAELAYQRDLLGTLMDYSPDSIFFKDLQSRFVKLSRSEANNLLRVSLSRYRATPPAGAEDPLPPHLASVEEFEKHVVGKSDADIYGAERAADFGHDEKEIMRTGLPLIGKLEQTICPDGGSIWYTTTKVPWRSPEGKIIGTFGTSRDISDLKNAETKLEQVHTRLFESQKMETVGKLAGGIAHEFNSILTAIIGQSELLLGDLPAGNPLIQNATEIIKAATRAATLTRQLLAYGRKQFLQPENLDLNQVIAGMESIFHNLMGGGVAVQIVPAAGLRAVKADAGQIEQVIMNMVINARDAMPNGGKLILETANVSFDADSAGRYPELKPGDYVMLAITDTGAGMNEAVKARAFEPFFSTKGVGQGTGLGLSTCYGIVKQSGGHISVYSELGRGTTFKIYLPQVEQKIKAKLPEHSHASLELPHGTETILLVEDDPALREMAATLLGRLGYTVFTASNGVEALSLKHEASTGAVDLLFTDVVMPHMSGKELADRVRALYPYTKILFTSAYTETAIVHQGVLDKGVALLQKPFTPSALAHKLREVLDQKKAPAN